MYKKIVSMTMAALLLAIAVVTVMVLAQPTSVFAANLEIVGDNEGISILPQTPIFNMENVAPGEVQNSIVTVRNSGETAFSCSISSEKENGDEDLFEGIEIKIENNDGTHEYFSGSLKSLKNVELGSVVPNGNKELSFSMIFPGDIGNELQGKGLSVKFIFIANSEQGEPGPSPSPSESPEPSQTPPGTTPVPSSEPDENTTELEDEVIPAGPVTTPSPDPTPAAIPDNDQDGEIETIKDEEIPQALPKTAGIPAEIYYLAGLAIVVLGIKMKRSSN